MKYLVTGGAGFIGSHLVDRLLANGHEVHVIDDFSTGSWVNLPALHPRLRIWKRSIVDDNYELFSGIDVVFHLAAKTRVQESIVKPEETETVNVLGTLKVLEECRDNKVKRLVFVSSSSLYGEQEQLPTTEDAKPNPMSPYALSKLMGEQYCKLFEKLYGVEANYIRPFNVFGTRQNPDGGYAAAVPKFIDMLRKGETPYITGDGEQRRDFVYIEDVVNILLLAAESKVYGEAFNIGSEMDISINDLYKTIAKILNKDIKPNHVPKVIEPRLTLSDMSKAKKLLGWELKTASIEEGLERMINVK